MSWLLGMNEEGVDLQDIFGDETKQNNSTVRFADLTKNKSRDIDGRKSRIEIGCYMCRYRSAWSWCWILHLILTPHTARAGNFLDNDGIDKEMKDSKILSERGLVKEEDIQARAHDATWTRVTWSLVISSFIDLGIGSFEYQSGHINTAHCDDV